MKNKEVIELTQGIFGEDWDSIPKIGCPKIDFEKDFNLKELLSFFEMWQNNPSLSKEHILKIKGGSVPLSIYTEYTPRIYFLIQGSEIVYVGRSENIASRLYTHLSQATKVFDSISLLDVGDAEELKKYEWPYIAKFMPKYNFPKKRPDIINYMHELLYVRKIDMVSILKEKISNTKNL